MLTLLNFYIASKQWEAAADTANMMNLLHSRTLVILMISSDMTLFLLLENF